MDKEMKQNEEIWVEIPGYDGRYELSNLGRVRTWYKYEQHRQKEHCRLMSPDGNNVELQGRKRNIPQMMEELFGLQYCQAEPGEIWADVKDFEDLYQVSSLGRVRSKPKYVQCKSGRSFYQHARFIKYCVINSGYCRVLFHRGDKLKSALVHRVVAEHFLPNPQGLDQVNHKNENKQDNRVENLEWCDRFYNARYGTNQERRIATRLKNNGGKYGVPRKNTRSAGVQE